jgi:hypothetical protein
MRIEEIPDVSPGKTYKVRGSTLNAIKGALKSLWRGDNIAVGGFGGGVTLFGTQSRSGGAADKKPWDLDTREDEPDSSDIDVTFVPGSFGGIVPANMFSPFTVSKTGTVYLIVSGVMDSGTTASCTLSVSGTHPSAQVQTLGGPPASLDYVIGVFSSGSYFNLAQKNLAVTPKESFRESDPSASPYGLPYRSYYVWSVT